MKHNINPYQILHGPSGTEGQQRVSSDSKWRECRGHLFSLWQTETFQVYLSAPINGSVSVSVDSEMDLSPRKAGMAFNTKDLSS